MAMLGVHLVSMLTNVQFRKSIYALILVIAFINPVTRAIAASASAPLTISVTVVRSCSRSTGLMLFGTNIPSSVTSNGVLNAAVTLVCPKEFIPAVEISHENRKTETINAQRIIAVGDKLRGQISIDSSPKRTVNDSEGGRLKVMPVRTESRDTIVPAETPSGKTALPGNPTDNVTITVNF